jgi:hypothetical protein
VVAALAGGILGVVALGYLAVTYVGHWTRSAPSAVSVPSTASAPPAVSSPSTSRERAPVRDTAPAPDAVTSPTAAAPKRSEVAPAPRAAETPRRVDTAPPMLPPRSTGLAVQAPARDERPGRTAAAAELTAALKAWGDTINRRQVAAHVAWYADPVPVFYSGRNVPRSTVRNVRARTVSDATRIDVRTSDPEIRIDTDGRTATMVFRESYVFEGPRINRRGSALQELKWRKGDDGWRIISERVREDDKATRTKQTR